MPTYDEAAASQMPRVSQIHKLPPILKSACRGFVILAIAPLFWLHAQSDYASPYAFTTFAGSAGPGSTDGTGVSARFRSLQGVAFGRDGNIYVADTGNHTIRKITPAGEVTTLAGTPLAAGWIDGMGDTARFESPAAIVVDPFGMIYVADAGNSTIRKITPSGAVTTFSGAANIQGSTDGPSDVARFDTPRALAIDPSGNLYVADSGNHTIRKITPDGIVSTVAGLAGVSGSTDGLAAPPGSIVPPT